MSNLLRYIIAAATVMLSAFFFSCRPKQSSEYLGTVFNISQEKLEAEVPDTLMLGRVHSGETIVKTVTFVNSTKEDITLLDYSTTCGCCTIEFKPVRLHPEEKFTTECHMDTTSESYYAGALLQLKIVESDHKYQLAVLSEIDF